MSHNQATPLMLSHTSSQSVVSCSTTPGRSRRRPCLGAHLKPKDIVLLVTLAGCLLLSVLVVTPRVTLAWRLGSKNQIVVVGLLLGIMSICVRSISCTTLLALEAHTGDSTLQNYEAILTDSLTASHTSTYLRAVLLSLLLLPLGLSIGYKQFLGGESSSTINIQIPDARYGIDYPSLGDYSMLSTGTYLWLNAYSGFSAQVNPWKITPLPKDLPNQAAPYGYNVLLLSNTSAAVLDIPSKVYMESIRKMMKPDETWYLNASVNAFVSDINPILDTVRKNDSFWKNSLEHTNSRMMYHGLTTVRRGGNWSDYGFGMIPEYRDNTGRGYGSCILGMYPDKVSDVVTITQYNDYDNVVVRSFRKTALRFDVQRRRCSASWRVSAEKIQLLSGHCPTSSPAIVVDSKVVEDFAPPSIDCLPNLWPALNWLNTSISGDDVPIWKVPSYSIAVAISYWSRAANQKDSGLLKSYNDVVYPPVDEFIVSIRSTLQANWLLYLILAAQPALGLFGLVVVWCLRGAYVGDRFGTLAVLARVEQSSLTVVGDANLDGKINRPIWLQIQNVERPSGKHEQPDETMHEVRYVLSSEKPTKG
ncbi:hypothetical protein OPT61_g6460 [Boeremia exigua]|uniref:Uncharacterized protein n=1 Tax=Boeremia exigua TaxID=749465 RepID=A0ACC2I6J3_9PLEO|nr:hypothetical protein OPT61_g6460 [Boeremia exigua]